MNDLDEALTGALNAAAHDGEVHVERLLTNARAAGLRYRRRRRVLVAGGAALAAVLPVVLVLVGWVAVRPAKRVRKVVSARLIWVRTVTAEQSSNVAMVVSSRSS